MTKKVLVLQGDSYKAVGSMFAARGYDVLYDTEKLPQVGLVVFTGGSDVSPYIYGEEPDGARGCDPVRDEYEREVFNYCKSESIPVVGICRGGQLLNVLNGGKMTQHLGTTISGVVRMVIPEDVESYETADVLVDHHQGIILGDAIHIAHISGHELISRDIGNQPVAWYAGFYPETKSLCFQPHPEWGHKGTEDYFFELLDKYVFPEGSEKESD